MKDTKHWIVLTLVEPILEASTLLDATRPAGRRFVPFGFELKQTILGCHVCEATDHAFRGYMM
jgi:hypothetical protein